MVMITGLERIQRRGELIIENLGMQAVTFETRTHNRQDETQNTTLVA